MQVLSLSQATIGQLSVGHIINLASNDVQRFDPVSLSSPLDFSVCISPYLHILSSHDWLISEHLLMHVQIILLMGFMPYFF